MNNNSNFNLPWGRDAYVGDGYHDEAPMTVKSELKCECGTTITMGKEDSPELHQDYCVIYKEYEKTNKKY